MLCDVHFTCISMINKVIFFTGEASLYQQTMSEWVSTIAMGRDKLKSPQSEKKLHDDRSEKREAIRRKLLMRLIQSLLIL